MRYNDTIAAISTAFGNAGIAIVRLSGKKSLPTLNKIFKPRSKKLKKFESHKLYYGRILDKKNKIIDEVLAVYFKSPNSYTKEDMAEIQCHGGFITANKILEKILEQNIRIARPGEFTERAFLNGRLDLTQAEAVADIIYAKSEKAQEIAEEQLQGKLKEKIKSILSSILGTYSHVLINIDFPDEDTPDINRKDIGKKITKPIKEIEEILKGTSLVTIYKEGLRVAIVGLPNVGKSSLLNALVKDARAIVTDIPGTTRDILEEQIEINGALIRLFDTAGITKTEDRIEKEGILRSFQAIKKADFLLLLTENYNDLKTFLSLIKKEAKKVISGKRILLIISKTDLKNKLGNLANTKELQIVDTIESSAKTGRGIKKIEKIIFNQIKEKKQESSILLANLRHHNLLKKALQSLKKTQYLSREEEAEDKILVEINSAANKLKEIIGETVTNDILNKVFARFCVGK